MSLRRRSLACLLVSATAATALSFAPAASAAPNACRASAPGAQPSQSERAALRGSFSILDQRPVRLVPPIDWNQDPFGSEAWRSRLHSLGWLDPLFDLYTRTGNRAALARARDIMLDWSRANPPHQGFGWADKISGSRAEALGFIVAAGTCRRLLSPPQRAALLAAVQAHGSYLANPANYNPGNHGLFMDSGLLTMTGYLPSVPNARAWRNLAAARFRRSLPVSSEGVDLEHSPSYQFLVIGRLASVLDLPGRDDPRLATIMRRMRAVAPWFVMPDGRLTRLGDTPDVRAQGWAVAASRRPQYRGIAPTRRSGFGIVRAPGSYLSVAAGYHPYGHKQADELTFELFERGRRVVVDTGRYGALRDRNDPVKSAQFEFTKTSHAHSVLLVDDKSFRFKRVEPYGSALAAAGSNDGWYALEGTNPLLARQAVSHRRLFIYRPGRALIIVDRVGSSASHTYTRLFQFDPRLSVTGGGSTNTVRLSGRGFSGWLHTAPGPGDQGTTIVRGSQNPLLGFTTSENRFSPMIPRSVAVHRATAGSAVFGSVISVAGRATVSVLASSNTSTTVALSQAGRPRTRVTVTRAGARLRVRAVPGS